MTPSADQVAAFQANGGFAPSAVSAVVLGFVFAVLLLWGVWAMRTAYVGWAEAAPKVREIQLSHSAAIPGSERIAALYRRKGFAPFGQSYRREVAPLKIVREAA